MRRAECRAAVRRRRSGGGPAVASPPLPLPVGAGMTNLRAWARARVGAWVRRWHAPGLRAPTLDR
eukprot:293811-Chlamydomonas_euryale.AAC.5